jgi:glycine cleavage system T protein (aminomethyltransferase)
MTEIQIGKKERQEELRQSPLDGPGTALDPAWFEQPLDEPPFARHVLTTPLHLAAAAENRTNDWVEWNGYTLAKTYSNFDQEYDALRTRAGLSDISPLVKYRISGKDAGPYLDRLLTRTVTELPIGGVARAALCASDGNLVTEGLLFRMEEHDFRLTASTSHLNWLLDSALGFEVSVEDVSGTIAGLSLAGPSALSVLKATGLQDIDVLTRNQAQWVELGGMPVYVSRTGMIGGEEFELWTDPSDAPVVWKRLLEQGAAFGLKPVGLAVRNVARIENGITLEGNDYGNAFEATNDLEALTPFSLGLGALVDLQNPLFNGKRALNRMATNGCKRVFVGLRLDTDEAAHLGDVFVGDRKIGRITSGTWSPSLCCHVALALVETEALGSSGGFTVEVAEMGVPSTRNKVSASLSKRPFLRFT